MKTKQPLPFPPGFHPFWFWNAELSAEEIAWQVAEMADKGIKGFYIHSRQGLGQPYMSEAFLDMVEAACNAAAEHGLFVHLYDEFPYPSGTAGGELLLGDPRFLATRLVQETHDVDGGHVQLTLREGRVLCCRAYARAGDVTDWSREIDLLASVGPTLTHDAYVEMGLTQYNRKRYLACEPRPALDAVLPPGQWRIHVGVQVLVEGFKYWGHYADVMNPAAVRRFLELTHERYFARIGKHFGTLVQSVFTDETRPEWSMLVPPAFEKEYGYDLLPLLPALQDASHPRHWQVTRDLHQLQYNMFCRSFEEPVGAWCREHNILYAAEKAALRLSQLRYMDIPGGDPGHTKAGAPMDLLQAPIRGNARAFASGAYFYGKAGSMCECYHSLGWGGTLQDAKLIAEGLLLMGVQWLIPHGFFYSSHALRKHDAPPSFFFQMPYWPLFGELSQRIGDIAEAFDGTWIDAQVLVVEPSSGLPSSEDGAAYERLLELLMAAHLDFLHVDTDILEDAKVEDGAVRVRDITARVVVVPPMQMIEPPLASWLDRFAGAGGTVVRCSGDVDPDEALARVRRLVSPTLPFDVSDGDGTKVQVVTRTNGSRRLWFLLNTGDGAVVLKPGDAVSLQELPLGGGERPGPRDLGDGGALRLEAFESVLLESVSPAAAMSAGIPCIDLPLPQAVTVTPHSPNLLRVYDWEMCLVDEDGTEGATATVPAVPLASQLADSCLPFPPRIVRGFGRPTELQMPDLHVRYRYEFENRFRGPVELLMEPDSIVGTWEVRINDEAPLCADAFRVSSSFTRGCLGVDVTPHLEQGVNRITVDVRTDRSDGGLLNALYLAGDFAVALAPPTLIDRPRTGRFEDFEGNGLPFYSGIIDYEGEVEIKNDPGEGAVLVEPGFDNEFRDACEISLNGGPVHRLPWSPRSFRAAPGELRAGANRVRIRVFTSLLRAFEGEAFDEAAHVAKPIGPPNAT